MGTELVFYTPDSVKGFLAIGGRTLIGIVDEHTVFKYAQVPGDQSTAASLDIEARMFEAIGPHARIIGYKGQRSDGIFLEYAPHGSVAQYMLENSSTDQQRLKWAHQASEALHVIHAKGILHCDVKVDNLLLDAALDVKLCDFQGQLLDSNGEAIKDGGSCENPKSFMPRADINHSDIKTDIFALGSALYHIMEGHEPYPDLHSFDDEVKIREKFKSGQFPTLAFSPMSSVVHKCWRGEYVSAKEVMLDIEEASQIQGRTELMTRIANPSAR